MTSTLAKRHIVVGHFVRSDTIHVMQAIDVTRHSRITQQLVPSTTVLSFICCSQFACKEKLLMTFGTTLVNLNMENQVSVFTYIPRERVIQSYRRLPQDCHILLILPETVREEFLKVLEIILM